jgi:hypothetical protein
MRWKIFGGQSDSGREQQTPAMVLTRDVGGIESPARVMSKVAQRRIIRFIRCSSAMVTSLHCPVCTGEVCTMVLFGETSQ